MPYERASLVTSLTVAALVGSGLACSRAAEPPTEFGRVPFQRDYAAGLAKAKADRKPLFVLFDEVPGCETCREFGRGPLSHPLVVAAAESEFVPVAVANNLPGADADVLRRFREPAWNNPVVRFLSTGEQDLIARKDGEYTAAFVLTRMAAALKADGKTVPAYLQLAVAEYAPAQRATAVFAMYCYWEGEAKLGKLDGVIGTRIGELHGSEVVEVTFDPTRVAYEALVKSALEMDCAHRVYARTDAQAEAARPLAGNRVTRSDAAIDARTQQQYHLAHYPQYHYLPLTALQATRVNAALAAKKSPDEFLSPSQVALRKRIEAGADQAKLKALVPDRSPKGIGAYALAVDRAFAK